MSKLIGTVAVSELLKNGVLTIGDGYRAKNSEMGLTGLPFARAGNINGGFQFDGADILSTDSVDKAGEKISSPGDVVFTSKGTVGRFAFVSENTPRFVYSPQLCYWRSLDHEVIDPRFLFYWMHGPEATAQIGWAKGQTDMADYVSLKDQRQAFKITLPDIHEQQRIAKVLGSLDDKIELNRRMNQTLEGIARALFKSWFVDFDPVRAKAEGRDTGLPKHIADLFPGRLVESELGDIPEGWSICPFPELIDVNPKRSLKKGELAPYLDMANVPTQGHSAERVILRKFGAGMRFKNGDTLVARITPCLENGKTAFVDFLDAEQIGWGSTEFIVMRPKHPLPPVFAYCLARDEVFRSFAIQSMVGTSGRQRVPADSLSHFKLAEPSEAVAEQFGQLVGPLFEKAREAATESRSLVDLRGALLPRLLSGELSAMEAA